MFIPAQRIVGFDPVSESGIEDVQWGGHELRLSRSGAGTDSKSYGMVCQVGLVATGSGHRSRLANISSFCQALFAKPVTDFSQEAIFHGHCSQTVSVKS